MTVFDPFLPAVEIARRVRDGDIFAGVVAEEYLSRITAINPHINAYTDVVADRALSHAAQIDRDRADGKPLPPLAGVPYAAKNLYDIAGLTTRAGSKINRENEPAKRDADLIERMDVAGAVCLGALNMGEFAYDFTGENVHDGACRNPHDTTRMTGGSSSGSGAATAAGLAPISLGTDTNGSLRVPASLCGVYSLKPTYGRLSRGGSFPFVDSFDHVGPLARTAEDLALAYDCLQGPSTRDHACRATQIHPTFDSLNGGISGLRIGVPRGWFDAQCTDDALSRRAQVIQALSESCTTEDIILDEAEIGRAAAYLITNSESATFHLPNLRTRADDFDPDTRDRFLAGALLPAAWVQKAQRVRHWWLHRALKAFETCDVLVVPATPSAAPLIGQKTLEVAGAERLLRPVLGLLAQPFSAIGLPVVTVPVFAEEDLPLGIQIVAAPWREEKALRVARFLEQAGVAEARAPQVEPLP